MKLLCPILSVLFFSFGSVKGEIKNGYLDIDNVRTALNSLVSTATTKQLSPQQSRQVKERIRIMTEHLMYFELTEKLLQQFQIMAPEIYNEINAIRDKNGKSVDVLVKFIPQAYADLHHPGTTYVKYNKGDNTCFSEYGAQTVSIKVWVMDTSLTILAHELGHVKYEVPNLADYDAYYQKNYRSLSDEPNYIGHGPNDPSGISASNYEKRFSENYRNYKRASLTKVPSPFELMRTGGISTLCGVGG